MAKPPYIIPRELADLPHLMAVGYLLALAGYGRSTLNARIAAGQMPKPVGRGRDGQMFNRDAVLRALGLEAPTPKPPRVSDGSEWMMTEAQQAELSEKLRDKRRRPTKEFPRI